MGAWRTMWPNPLPCGRGSVGGLWMSSHGRDGVGAGGGGGVGGISLGPSAEAGLSPARHSKAVRHKSWEYCNPVGAGWPGGLGRSG